jgi:NAD(P)-dependent dehydrogenase (short-subunit alcohol dehydrogenase family)
MSPTPKPPVQRLGMPTGRHRQQGRLRQRVAHRDHRRRRLPAQFETNFWGVYHVSKAAIPLLREQGGGLFMQISSVGGRVGGSPGIASYQAAKFAIDGFSRVLRAETAPFGVKVIVVEPSGFRTDWAGSSMTVHDIPEAYAPTVGAMNSRVRQSTDGPPGDPARAAEILVQVAKRRDIPYHLPL